MKFEFNLSKTMEAVSNTYMYFPFGTLNKMSIHNHIGKRSKNKLEKYRHIILK